MLRNIIFVISILALSVMFLAAVAGLLTGGLEGVLDNSYLIGVSLIIYIIAYGIFLIM